MRIWLLAIVALVLGVMVGVGMTAWELLRSRDDYGLLDPHGPFYDTPFPTIPRDSAQRPRVVVESGEVAQRLAALRGKPVDQGGAGRHVGKSQRYGQTGEQAAGQGR